MCSIPLHAAMEHTGTHHDQMPLTAFTLAPRGHNIQSVFHSPSEGNGTHLALLPLRASNWTPTACKMPSLWPLEVAIYIQPQIGPQLLAKCTHFVPSRPTWCHKDYKALLPLDHCTACPKCVPFLLFLLTSTPPTSETLQTGAQNA